MKSINIIKRNAASITAKITETNGRSKAHTWADYGDLAAALSDSINRAKELKREAHIPLTGDIFTLVSGEKLPSSYRGMPMRTVAWIEKTNAGYKLIALSCSSAGHHALPKIMQRAEPEAA